MKYLYRSRDNRIVGGVMGGIGEYFNIDPVLVRVAFVLLLVLTAVIPGLIAYIAAILLIPKKPLPAPHREAQSRAGEASS